MEFRPVTRDRWGDFEKLFGPSGAYSGCWCMWWRSTRSEFDRNRNKGNRKSMRGLVESGVVPGILGYEGGEPIGWCSVAPREDFGSLNRSRVLKPVDDKPVWSIVCFFIHKNHRDEGIGTKMIEGAVQYARDQGAEIVEAYPTKPRGKRLDPASSFMGIPKVFERAGFERVADPSEAKAIMRYYVQR
ncbi:MAG: GNAT family N-acetyltransferase [Chloroflexi bacterium]|nr:GNAT family N-acetyltransferase [Chloroflexota bacterium]